MPYFDFHVHPTLKCFFSEDNAATNQSKLSPWQFIDVRKVKWYLQWCTEFDYILQSQSNLTELINSETSLVCVALYMPERAMTTDPLILGQAHSSKLNAYLQPHRIDVINKEQLKPYPDLLYEDIEKVLLNMQMAGAEGKKIIPLKKGVVYDPSDKSALYIVFSIEGCHTLLPSLEQPNYSKDDVINNLDELSVKYPVVSINVTHLQQFPFCNHAYGILFLASEDFIPTGNRISTDGVEIIKHCYEKRILVDIKHMSLGARRWLIENLRKSEEFIDINQPIVCTHAGFTGISYNDIPDYINYTAVSGKNYGYIAWGKPSIYGYSDLRIAFNPSSINLFDEDIIAILLSGGMIGLNMDKRILGYAEPEINQYPKYGIAWDENLPFEEEFISINESDCFLTKRNLSEKVTDSFCVTKDDVRDGSTTPSDLADYHLFHFISHILHLVKVAVAYSYDTEQALKQICIGSDFDGLINPIYPCMNAKQRNNFKNEFIQLFPLLAKENENVVKLPPGFDIGVFAEDLFYNNGKDFILNRLNLIYSQ